MGGKSKSKTQKVEVQPWPDIIPYITGPQGVLPEAQRLYLERLQMAPQIRGLQQQFIKTIGQTLPYYNLMNEYYLDLFKRLVSGRYNFDALGFLEKIMGGRYRQIPTPVYQGPIVIGPPAPQTPTLTDENIAMLRRIASRTRDIGDIPRTLDPIPALTNENLAMLRRIASRDSGDIPRTLGAIG